MDRDTKQRLARVMILSGKILSELIKLEGVRRLETRVYALMDDIEDLLEDA